MEWTRNKKEDGIP